MNATPTDRYVVERRPAKAGERFLMPNGVNVRPYDIGTTWVIVETLPEAPVSPSAARTPPERVDDTPKPLADTQSVPRNPWDRSTWFNADGELKQWSPWPAPASEAERHIGPESVNRKWVLP